MIKTSQYLFIIEDFVKVEVKILTTYNLMLSLSPLYFDPKFKNDKSSVSFRISKNIDKDAFDDDNDNIEVLDEVNPPRKLGWEAIFSGE